MEKLSQEYIDCMEKLGWRSGDATDFLEMTEEQKAVFETRWEERVMKRHSWYNASYHGSPTWECRACGIRQTESNCREYCERATKEEQERLDEIERKDRADYERIRFLLNKYDT